MIFETLGDRMKYYESYNNDKFPPNLPVCVRLDGKGFHNYTRGFDKPFDERLHDAMNITTETLIDRSNAKVGYTQSDEITLIFIPEKVYFDGKPQKICSVLASIASVTFNKVMRDKYNIDREAIFDCRSFFLPTLQECVNCLVWREQDAIRNSIQMASRSLYSHNECDNKNCSELQEMLHKKSVNWNDYSLRQKRGEYYISSKVTSKMTLEDMESLPEKHHAKLNPTLEVTRTEVKKAEFIKLSSVENQVELLFGK